MSRLLASLALVLLACPALGLSGCCLCDQPYDECGPVLGEEHYGCVRKGSAFSDYPAGRVIYEPAPGETIPPPPGPSEPEVYPGPTNGRPAPPPPPPPPSSTTRKKSSSRSALVPR
jgi:hypothetical protein